MSAAGRPFGKFTLVEKIGTGGMAEIWRASLSGVDGFNKQCVIKKILPRYAGNQSFITMFIQEAKVCSVLQHANVVQIFELGDVDGDYYIAMEYVKGNDLLCVLTQATKLRKPIPAPIGLFIVEALCKGLGYAHQATSVDGKQLQITHLDVSPSNVLLSYEGEVKITDFGVARASIEGSTTGADDRLKGKLGYMSPEQVTGKPIDQRSDLFSVGIILYELLTLKRLFLGKTDLETLSNIRDADIEPRLRKHADVIPPGVADIIRKCLTRNIDSRYQTAYELEEAISRYLFDERQRVTPLMLSSYMNELFSHGSDDTDNVDAPSEQFDSNSPEQTIDNNPVVESTRVIAGRSPASDMNEASFRLKSANSSLFGPVSFQNFQDLIRTKSVSPDELVSVDGARWRRLAEVTILEDVLPEDFGDDTEQPTSSGVFDAQNSVRVLAKLVCDQMTGRLKVKSNSSVKQVYFRRGKPMHIYSNSKRELLGSVLVERGVINIQQLSEAISSIEGKEQPLGDVLLKLGHINAIQLFQFLEEQFREKFLNLIGLEEASYQYFDGEIPGTDAVPFVLDPIPAIAEGVRRSITDDVCNAFIKGKMNRVCRLVGDPPFGVTLLKLTPREFRVKALLEGRATTIAKLIESYGQNDESRNTLLFVVFLLHQTGHIDIS